MQHIIEEDGTQQDGHKVPSHGWPTCNRGNDAKGKARSLHRCSTQWPTCKHQWTKKHTEGRTEETDASLSFWKHPLNLQKENIFFCLSPSLINATRFVSRTTLSLIKEVKNSFRTKFYTFNTHFLKKYLFSLSPEKWIYTLRCNKNLLFHQCSKWLLNAI